VIIQTNYYSLSQSSLDLWTNSSSFL